MKFACSGCGVCCTRIGEAAKIFEQQYDDPLLQFPFSWDEEGRCSMLEGTRCKVYQSRPLVCNVERLAEYLKLDKKAFFRQSAQACNTLMDSYDIPQSFRIRQT